MKVKVNLPSTRNDLGYLVVEAKKAMGTTLNPAKFPLAVIDQYGRTYEC